MGSRLLLLAAVIMAVRTLPPQTNGCRMTKGGGTGRKHFNRYVGRGVIGCGVVSTFSGQSDSGVEILCAPLGLAVALAA